MAKGNDYAINKIAFSHQVGGPNSVIHVNILSFFLCVLFGPITEGTGLE